ncbi:NAD-specific glutamate dehydrogenase [compost metagenome]
MQAVGHGCGGRFVDQALDFQAGKLGGKAGALALLVAEIGRHGNHRFADRATEKRFGIGLECTEHQRRQFFGAEYLVTEGDLFFAAHEALEGGGGALRMGSQA